MGEIVIRPMSESDREAAMELLESWNMAPRPPTADVPHPERATLRVENSFVALEDDRLVGVCSFIPLEKTRVETASLAVDPALRGKGVGFRLQQARLEEMRARGFKHVRTETDRPETVRWYVEKFGYRVVGRNPKKHPFSLPTVNHWTVLELDL